MQQEIVEYYNSHADKIIELKKKSRIDQKEQDICIENIPKKDNLKILEVGFGIGTLIKRLIEMLPDSSQITGIEISQAMFDIAKKDLVNANLYLGDFLEESNELEDNYDVLICLGVIEHYKGVEAFFDRFRKLVKEEGTLILSFAQSSLLGRVTAYRCKRKGAPAYTHKRKKIKNTLKSKGFLMIKDIYLGLSQRMMIFEKH